MGLLAPGHNTPSFSLRGAGRPVRHEINGGSLSPLFFDFGEFRKAACSTNYFPTSIVTHFASQAKKNGPQEGAALCGDLSRSPFL